MARGAYVTGRTQSSDLRTTAGVLLLHFGPYDGGSAFYVHTFVTRLNPAASPPLHATFSTGPAASTQRAWGCGPPPTPRLRGPGGRNPVSPGLAHQATPRAHAVGYPNPAGVPATTGVAQPHDGGGT